MEVEKIKSSELPKGSYYGYPATQFTLDAAIEAFKEKTGHEPDKIYEVTCSCHGFTTYYLVHGYTKNYVKKYADYVNGHDGKIQ